MDMLPKKVKPRRLIDLEAESCRFPVARKEETFFCAEPRRDVKTAYCAKHHNIVWVKSTHTKKVRRAKSFTALGLRSPMRD